MLPKGPALGITKYPYPQQQEQQHRPYADALRTVACRRPSLPHPITCCPNLPGRVVCGASSHTTTSYSSTATITLLLCHYYFPLVPVFFLLHLQFLFSTLHSCALCSTTTVLSSLLLKSGTSNRHFRINDIPTLRSMDHLFVKKDGSFQGWLAALLCCCAAVNDDEHPNPIEKRNISKRESSS